MRIIITGASGFIGKYLINEFLNNGDEVYSVIRFNSLSKINMLHHERHHLVESDLEDLTAAQFPTVDFDAFYHMGWHGVNRDEIDNSDIHKQNYNNAQNCLEVCKQLNCKCFLDAGSRAEYGDISKVFSENIECFPDTAYSREKFRFYQFAYNYCKTNDLKYIHFRLFSVIGKFDHPWSLISSACAKLSQNETMKMGACTQLWNFMDVRDAVTAMRRVFECIELVKENDNRIVNIASHDTRILRSFIEEIRIILNSKSLLEFNIRKTSNDIFPDISKLVHLTGWQAKYSFADTIKDILE